LPLFIGAVCRLLQIEIGQYAQQGRADIDAVPACQIEQTVEGGIRERLGHTLTLQDRNNRSH
jgi:hypothetical protein